MKVEKSTAITAQQFESINDLIIDAIRDIKGKNIIQIDLSKIEDAPAKNFVICEGESIVQVKSIALNIQKRVRNEWGLRNDHLEGLKESKWVLIDYFDTIVHVFYPETRHFYDIEGLWSDGHFVEYQDL